MVELLFYARYYRYKDEKDTVILPSAMTEEIAKANKSTKSPKASSKIQKEEPFEPERQGPSFCSHLVFLLFSDYFYLTTDKHKQQKFEFLPQGVGMLRREIFCSSDKEFIDE